MIPLQPDGAQAVMSSRREPPDALDYFPTPPWATRALLYDVLAPRGLIKQWMNVWEPAAGEGHMVRPLSEFFHRTYASDVHDYGRGYHVGSFVGEGPDVIDEPQAVDWIITNPPFNLALPFVERALNGRSTGVERVCNERATNTAVLVRSVWAEGRERYEKLFRDRPPSWIAQFCDRVPMVKGRYDPNASTATSYAWFIWVRGGFSPKIGTKFTWIPPGAPQRHKKPHDVEGALS